MIGKSKATVCIEGKTDESFGEQTVAPYYQQMKHRRRAGVSTRVPERIEKLVSMLSIPPAEAPSCAVADNRYQLVTALEGTALQAKIDHSDMAILLIHEFHTDDLDPQKIQKNIQDYTRFVNAITGDTCEDGANGKLRSGWDCLLHRTCCCLILLQKIKVLHLTRISPSVIAFDYGFHLDRVLQQDFLLITCAILKQVLEVLVIGILEHKHAVV